MKRALERVVQCRGEKGEGSEWRLLREWRNGEREKDMKMHKRRRVEGEGRRDGEREVEK